MTEEELIIRLEDFRQRQAGRQAAGDGGVHSIDEVLRELMAHYQPLPTASRPLVPQPVAC